MIDTPEPTAKEKGHPSILFFGFALMVMLVMLLRTQSKLYQLQWNVYWLCNHNSTTGEEITLCKELFLPTPTNE